MRKRQRGLSLIEVLVSVAILAIVFVIVSVAISLQVSRARDARRKSDLDKIKNAFEEYYNDHNCYPPSDILNNCGGPELKPYLNAIPCDPESNQPYLYVPKDGDECGGYRVLTQLEDLSDPSIKNLDCDGPGECQFGPGYNYGISQNVPVKGDGTYVSSTPTPTPTATPTPSISPSATPTPAPTAAPTPTVSPTATPTPAGVYACDPQGACNVYFDPWSAGCPVTFLQSNCNNQCGNPANWCVQ